MTSRNVYGIFVFAIALRPALGHTQLPSQWVPDALYLGVKWPGREAENSPPSNAEIKNAWTCTSTLTYAFMEFCLYKHRIHLHGVVLKLSLTIHQFPYRFLTSPVVSMRFVPLQCILDIAEVIN